MEEAKRIGMSAYAAKLDEKIRVLEELIRDYDDGRRKSYFCTAVNLLALNDVKAIIEKAKSATPSEATQKEKATAIVRLFDELAQKRDVSLKLRK